MNTVKKGEFLLKKHEINPFKDLKFRRISEISKKKCIHSEKSDEVMANMLLLQSDNIQRTPSFIQDSLQTMSTSKKNLPKLHD